MTVTLSKFFAAERNIVGPPMSMFSISSSAVKSALRCGRFKRIKIHYDEIDRRDAMFLRLRLVFLVLAAIEQTAVHLRMERFHPSAKHFRPAGKVRNIFHRDFASRSSFDVPPVDKISIFNATSRLAKSTMPVLSNTLISARSTAMPFPPN